MNLNEAYKLLGVSENDTNKVIKTKYRELIFKHHPDSSDNDEASIKKAQLINEAFDLIKKDKKKHPRGTRGYGANSGARKTYSTDKDFSNFYEYDYYSEADEKRNESHHFRGKTINNAYTSRDIFESPKDSVIRTDGFIKLARGKFLWEPDKEDFECFIHSIILESDSLLKDVELAVGDRLNEDINLESTRNFFRMRLFHLLAKDYVNPIFSLRKILKANQKDENGDRIYEIKANLATVGVDDYYKRLYSLRLGDNLYPSKLKNNRLQVETNTGVTLGNLTIEDDRMLYVVIPILERKLARVKIVVRDINNNRAKRPYRINVGISLFLKIEKEVLEEEIKLSKFEELSKEISEEIGTVLKEYEEAIKE